MAETPMIYGAISRVMAEIGSVSKDRKNETQGYKFRGIEDMYLAAHPALVKHGVFCCPQVLEYESQDRVTGQGKPSIRVTMKVSHKFYGPDGSFVDVITCGEGIDSSDKATNKAMSAAMKYALIELFSVPTQDVEDDTKLEDADRHSPEVGVRSRPVNVQRTTADIPIAPKTKAVADVKTDALVRELPPAADRITAEDSGKLHRRFRESLSEDLRPKADVLLLEWLGQKLYLDASGAPSALAIRKDDFASVGKAAMAWAKELSTQTVEEVII